MSEYSFDETSEKDVIWNLKPTAYHDRIRAKFLTAIRIIGHRELMEKMSVKEEYLDYRKSNDLKIAEFSDRVKLQTFLRERIDKIWAERPKFTNGGLLSNHMTGFALGFAYYDCRSTAFCRSRCYGLRISGLHDYYMLRLSVITSESQGWR